MEAKKARMEAGRARHEQRCVLRYLDPVQNDDKSFRRHNDARRGVSENPRVNNGLYAYIFITTLSNVTTEYVKKSNIYTGIATNLTVSNTCLLYTSPSPRDS